MQSIGPRAKCRTGSFTPPWGSIAVTLLARELDGELSVAIAAGGAEPDIIRNYDKAVGNIAQTPHSKVRSGFIHQRPYALFVSPTSIAGREKCELGDILYVYKRLDLTGKITALSPRVSSSRVGALLPPFTSTRA